MLGRLSGSVARSSLTVAATSPEASSAARSATAGNYPTITLFSVWKLRAIGPISTGRASAFWIPTLTFGTKLDGLGLFTGQFGFALDTWLWYVKGGAAVTSNTFTVSSTLGGIGLASASSTRWGGVLGTGFEYAFAPNWSVGLEYDHLFMGGADFTFPVANPVLAGTLSRITQDVDMVTVRLNYRFGGFGGPLVAKY